MDYNVYQNQINKINDFLVSNVIHVFYICISPEKSSGIESISKNFHVICLKKDDFWNALTYKENNFCLEDKIQDININNSFEFLKLPQVIEWIHSFNANRNCLISFKNTPRFVKLAELHKFEVLNNFPEISNFVENKFNLLEIAKNAEVRIPESEIIKISAINSSIFPYVLQFPFGHTGNGTFIIQKQSDLENLKNGFGDSKVKLSKYISGISVNINGIVTNTKTYVSGLNIQLTGIQGLSKSSSVTCGNNYNFDQTITQVAREQILNSCVSIGDYLRKIGYKGLFGIDLIIEKDTGSVYIIEINARQTANISFYNKIQNENCQINSLLLHILTFLNYNLIPNEEYNQINTRSAYAGQLICRNYLDEGFKLNEHIMKNKFRLKSPKILFSSVSKNISVGEEVFRIQSFKEDIADKDEVTIQLIDVVQKIKEEINLNY